MKHQLCRRLAVALAAAGCLAAVGCGPGSISGKISYKGEPLGGGTVVFSVPGKDNASSTIGPDGSYHIDKIATGTAKISVETDTAKPPVADPRRPANMPTAPPPDKAPPGAVQPQMGQPGEVKGKYVKIPEKYNDLESSGLTYDVKAGAQTKDIDLPEAK